MIRLGEYEQVLDEDLTTLDKDVFRTVEPLGNLPAGRSTIVFEGIHLPVDFHPIKKELIIYHLEAEPDQLWRVTSDFIDVALDMDDLSDPDLTRLTCIPLSLESPLPSREVLIIATGIRPPADQTRRLVLIYEDVG